MADLSAAWAARQAAVGGDTHENDAWSWNCYVKYCNRIGLGGNYFLKECTDSTELKLWELLPWLCIEGNFCNRVMVPW
jgi:hypothetical protein